MDFVTHAIGLRPTANRRFLHVRTAKMDPATGPATPSRDATLFAPEAAGHESPAYRFPSGPGARVEYALFAVTLAAVGYLYLGVALAQAMNG